MRKTCWRERREAYLRESGRTADLFREGFIKSDLVVIEGGGHRRKGRRKPLALRLIGVHDSGDSPSVPKLSEEALIASPIRRSGNSEGIVRRLSNPRGQSLIPRAGIAAM